MTIIALETPLVGVKRSGVVVVAGLAGVASALVVTALAAEVPAMMVVGVVGVVVVEVVEGIPGTSVLTAGCEDAGVLCPWLTVTVVFWMTGSVQKMTNFSLKILTNLNSSSLCGCLG